MTKPESSSRSRRQSQRDVVTRITVFGYKSIAKEQSIEVRPLTILAGANSSGKSSFLQPLLLLKQTLEATYDPGALLLDGPNIRFTAVEQMLAKCGESSNGESFSVGIGVGSGTSVTLTFEQLGGKGVHIHEMSYETAGESGTLREGMGHDEIVPMIPAALKDLTKGLAGNKEFEWIVVRDRCFLGLTIGIKGKAVSARLPFGPRFPFGLSPSGMIQPHIRGIIHLPGLRGNPRRFYPKTAVGSTFPGVFQDYTASVITKWQEDSRQKLNLLGRDLKMLGLTWKVAARPIDDTQVELKVGRLADAARGGGWDLVNIADVGFGVSQALPVLVALRAAEPGQIVYLEQPEIHLHPKAQLAMARVLADAANRGVRVIAETHSILLLLGIQSLVAKGESAGGISPDKVVLHWFQRSKEDGCTEVKSANLDEAGAFGDWPEDFAETELKAQSAYLDAVEAKQVKETNG